VSRGKQVHVTKREEGWAVVRGGAERASSLHSTQSRAIKEATKTAKREGAELFIHGRDNLIRERNSYGHDPYPPWG
jgi:hypothetical protein